MKRAVCPESQVTAVKADFSSLQPKSHSRKTLIEKEANDGFYNLFFGLFFLIHALAYLRDLQSLPDICLSYCDFPFPRYKQLYVK